ncbi:MAG: DUF6514 family protein [Eubacteriales bacterium]|nr:DUF6514 family protein [Eubacteriales bacterium]
MPLVRFVPVEETLYSPEIGTYHSFGIRALEKQSGKWVETAFVSDVCCERAFVDRLAEQCRQRQVAPCHLLDVVLDGLE